MRLSIFSLCVITISAQACSSGTSDEASDGTSEQDLTQSCTGDYKKVSELVLAPQTVKFGSGIYPRHVIDYDGDGHLDVVVIDDGKPDTRTDPTGPRTFELAFFRGDGHGSLAPAVVTNLHAHQTESFRFGDFDGDGKKDLLYQGTRAGWQQVSRLADGTWGAPKAVHVDSACAWARGGSGYVTAVEIADFDGDKKDDVRMTLVTADSSGAEFGTVLVRGTTTGLGVPSCKTATGSDAFGDAPHALRHTKTGDFDGDGKEDLVGYGQLRHMRYALDWGGTPALGALNSSNHNNMAYRAVVGRFDKDGVDDVADLTLWGVELYYGDPASPFARRASFDGLPNVAGLNTGSMFAGDFNGDGRTDFVFFSPDQRIESGERLTPTVCSIANGNHRRYETKLPLLDVYAYLEAVGDFDEDGKTDLLIRTQDDRFRSYYRPDTDAPSRFVIFKK